MKKKPFFTLFSLGLVLICLFCACSSAPKSGLTESGKRNESLSKPGIIADAGDSQESKTSSEALGKERKLIRTVDISAEAKEYDLFLETLRETVSSAGGYIEESACYESGNARGRRSSYFVLRIPEEKTDGALAALEEKGTFSRYTQKTQDVTLNYVDTQARLNALRAEESKLLELMEKTESVSETISVQERLTEIVYEIEACESTLRTYDQQIAYCTVTLSVSEAVRETEEETSVWARIGTNLKNSAENIGVFFREAFVGIVSALPYLLLAALIVLILIFAIIRPIFRSRKKRTRQDTLRK